MSVMSIDQLAQNAYLAYLKKAIEVDDEGLASHHVVPWVEKNSITRECWVAVIQQVLADFSTLH